MNPRIHIGTSGFGIAKADYVKRFRCVEIQHTFYQPPRVATIERWRKESPAEFEFTLKAWQLITHEANSPTYRRLKRNLSENEKQEAGGFRRTTVVDEAWETTLACANALQATTILFQCPASFRPTPENISNLKKFFTRVGATIDRNEFHLCWEPRGDWDHKLVQDLCEDLNLWHVVDPFVNKTATPDRCYYRLHGRNGWRYQYEDAELHELVAMLPAARSSRRKQPVYVFFNNMRMTDDAFRFQQMIESSPA